MDILDTVHIIKCSSLFTGIYILTLAVGDDIDMDEINGMSTEAYQFHSYTVLRQAATYFAHFK